MAIAINGAGTITGVSVGGLPDGCIAAADIASGVIPAGGKTLQVVQDTLTSEWTTTSGSYTPVLGLSVSITPASTSKVLVMGVLTGAVGASTTGGGICVKRDSTIIFVGDADATQTTRFRGLQSYRVDHNNNTRQTTINYLDTHGADGSTAVVYTWQVFAEAAGTFYVNTCNAPTIDATYYGQYASSIIAIEIGA